MFTLNTDGGARGNPGPAAIGFVIKNAKGEVVFTGGEKLGSATNNYAEYKALIAGLTKAMELEIKNISCLLASELVVKQLKKEYRVKDLHLKDLYDHVQLLLKGFDRVDFTHIPRAKNKAADAVVNAILDGKNI